MAHSGCYGLGVLPPNSYVEALTPNIMAFGDLDAVMKVSPQNGISILIKRERQEICVWARAHACTKGRPGEDGCPGKRALTGSQPSQHSVWDL